MFDNEWGGAVASTKIEGVWMWGPWVMNNPERLIEMGRKEENAGDGECVAIAQWTLKMPHTSHWRPGVKVLGNSTPTYYEGHEVIEVGLSRELLLLPS